MVQGEGRGHMTQSITMKAIIEKAGIELCGVLIGKSERREIPEFYKTKIGVPLTTIDSPNFATDKQGKAIRTLPSLISTLSGVPHYLESLKIIDTTIKKLQPDLIINFYEPLCGAYYMLHRPSIPAISIAHQYLFLDKNFETPKSDPIAEQTMRIYTRLTAAGSAKKLALSFYPFETTRSRRVYVVPPLLRKEVSELKPETGNYFLVYLLNSGYMDEIITWHKKNPTIELHCFTDKKEIEETTKYDDTLFFHKINDKKFMDLMAGSKGLLTSAGFESVCEAMYLQKPVFMVPVEGHYEQFCNSRDAAKAGAGIYDSAFNLDRFIRYVNSFEPNQQFKEWAEKSPALITEHIESVLRNGSRRKQRRTANERVSM